MNEYDLKMKSEELEQTLNKQIELLKKDSEIYVKLGGIALLTGIISYTIVRRIKKKNREKESEYYPSTDHEHYLPKKAKKKKKKESPSFLKNLRNRIFWALIEYGKIVLIQKYAQQKPKLNENEV